MIKSSGQDSSSYLRSKANSKHYLSLPFTMMHGVPVAELTVNGNSHELFIIDSGFSKSVLDLDAASRLGVKVSREAINMNIRGTGDSNNSPAWATSKLKIQYFSQTILNGTLPAIRLDAINRLSSKPITGIIGYDLISAHPVALDYLHGVFTIFGDNTFEPTSTSIHFKLDHGEDGPIITTSFSLLNGDLLQGRILVDTGSQFGLEINRPFGQKNGLYDLQGWAETKGFGIGGSYVSLHGIPGELWLGNHKIKLEDVFLTKAEKGQTAVGSFDGNLGSAVLNKFLVIFDAPHGQIFFDPNR